MKKLLFLIFVLTVAGIFLIKKNIEPFTSPSLTLIKPPSWFPQNSAETYDKKKWKVKVYFDRNNKENEKADAFRFWKN